jgi:hypothetical protein
MIDIPRYYQIHRQEIVDAVTAKETANAIQGNSFEGLVSHLKTTLPLGRDGQSWRDKAHEELAIAIIHSMWCGWLSQAKKNRGVYTQEYVDCFKHAFALCAQTEERPFLIDSLKSCSVISLV